MLTKKDVLAVADLASLELTKEEISKFHKELNEVLGLFERVDKADLKGFQELSQVTGLKNVLSGDKVSCVEGLTCCTREQLLSGAPIVDSGAIITPRVIEK